MSLGILKYNLSNPNEKATFDEAHHGLSYKKLIRNVITMLDVRDERGVLAPKSISNIDILREIRRTATVEGLSDIKEFTALALRPYS